MRRVYYNKLAPLKRKKIAFYNVEREKKHNVAASDLVDNENNKMNATREIIHCGYYLPPSTSSIYSHSKRIKEKSIRNTAVQVKNQFFLNFFP